MARPISWLPRLTDMQRLVSKTKRTHYDRQQLEDLFQIQSRAAQKLMEILPSETVGKSLLVPRETVSAFLEGIKRADDPYAFMASLRRGKDIALRMKLNTLVSNTVEPLNLDALPSNISFKRGLASISFDTKRDLLEAMYATCRMLIRDGDHFAERYETGPAAPRDSDYAAFLTMLTSVAELERQTEMRLPSSTES